MKIFAVVVIYNVDLALSASFKSASGQADVQVLVVDNSTDQSFNNQETARQAGSWFLSMGTNQGLAKAYNRALEYLADKQGDWVVLLDDDTTVPASYWNQLRTVSCDRIWLPQVRTEKGTLISPAQFRHGFVHRIESCKDIENVTGINSGMAVPKTVFESYRYDERYFLDYIDHQFMKDMAQRQIPASIMNCVLKQSFSAESDDVTASLLRIRRQKKDLDIFYEDCPWRAAVVYRKRLLALAVHSKKIGVLFHG